MYCENLATFLKNKAADEQISLSETIGRAKLLLQSNGFKLTVLDCGSCEALNWECTRRRSGWLS